MGGDLSDDGMESGTCPLGLWDGLTPVDMAAEAAAAAAEAKKKAAAQATKVDAFLKTIAVENSQIVRDALVANEVIKPEVATELEVKALDTAKEPIIEK